MIEQIQFPLEHTLPTTQQKSGVGVGLIIFIVVFIIVIFIIIYFLNKQAEQKRLTELL